MGLWKPERKITRPESGICAKCLQVHAQKIEKSITAFIAHNCILYEHHAYHPHDGDGMMIMREQG